MSKEFASVRASENLSSNYLRILKDTTELTQLSYHKRFKGWGIVTPKDILKFIDDVQEKWLDAQYRYSTLRQYKATIGYALSNAYQFKIDPSALNFRFKEYYAISQHSTIEELEHIYQKSLLLGTDSAKSALDKQASYNEKTSSIKDKRFSDKVFYRIMELDRPKSISLLQTFIQINIKIGLRPIEYNNAMLIRHDLAHNKQLLKVFGFTSTEAENALNLTVDPPSGIKPLLLVKNAKNSHSRACGDYRLLYLDVLSNSEINMLVDMLLTMREIKENNGGDFRKSVIEPLQRQLYYVLTTDNECKKIIKQSNDERFRQYRFQSKTKNRNKPTFKRPTLYSTRHQAVANAKAEGLHPVEIAACFGHASIFTAESHYGKKLFSNGRGSLSPTQVSVNEVVSRLSESNIQNIEKRMRNHWLDSTKKEPQVPKNIGQTLSR